MRILKRLTDDEKTVLVQLLFDYEKQYNYDMVSLFNTKPSPNDLKGMIRVGDIDGIRNLIRNKVAKETKRPVEVVKDC